MTPVQPDLTGGDAAPTLPMSDDPDLPTEAGPLLRADSAGRGMSGRLWGKVALVSGGNQGMGHAAALAFAHEGANVAILYLDGHESAQETMRAIVEAGGETMAVTGDIGISKFCNDAVDEVVKRFGRIDILVNAAAEHHAQPDFASLEDLQIERSFRTNILGQFFLTRAAMPHLSAGAAIVNTSSIIGVTGDAARIDDAATQGAILAFTRSLALALASREVRANAIAPGPACPPEAAAAAYLFLAGDGSRHMSGQVLYPDGGSGGIA